MAKTEINKPQLSVVPVEFFRNFVEDNKNELFQDEMRKAIDSDTMLLAENSIGYNTALVSLSLIHYKSYPMDGSSALGAPVQVLRGLGPVLTDKEIKDFTKAITKAVQSSEGKYLHRYTLVSDRLKDIATAVSGSVVKVWRHPTFHCPVVEIAGLQDEHYTVFRFLNHNNDFGRPLPEDKDRM